MIKIFTVNKKDRVPLIQIKSLQQIKVVDEDGLAGPDGRYTAERDEKKD